MHGQSIKSIDSPQGAVFSPVKEGARGVQGGEVLGECHALPPLTLGISPGPLAILPAAVGLAGLVQVVGGPEIVLAAAPAARPLGEEPALLQQDGRMHGEAAELEDVLAEGGGVDARMRLHSS
ncbi:hypothetical protein VTK73DRAFT_10327 [Phialemonium thermophilum]|uniref:Uncharacterized protein n=1 Tax=Phialemonium thermophilum TaxID=223376 RepID=A0ABR3VX93_9PEZI